MPRVLVTAFEPFDGSGLNASLEAARAYLAGLPAEGAPDLRILPVRYADGIDLLRQALREVQPEILLHTGQSRRSEVAAERIAVNVRTASDDWEAVRDGGGPQEVILPGAPAAYFGAWPVEQVAAAITERGVPVTISNHAGIYMCNHIYFQSLHMAAVSGEDRQVGFLHLPRLPAQRAPAEAEAAPSLEQLAAAIDAALEAMQTG